MFKNFLILLLALLSLALYLDYRQLKSAHRSTLDDANALIDYFLMRSPGSPE